MNHERIDIEMVKAKKLLNKDGIKPVVKLFTERFEVKHGLNSITNLVAMLLYCGLNYEDDAFERFIDLFTQKINDKEHPFVPTMMTTFTDLLLNWSELLKPLIFTDAECKSASGSTAACAASDDDALESFATSMRIRQVHSYKNALSCTALYLQKRNIFTRDTIDFLLDNVKQMLIFRVYMPPQLPPRQDRSSELMQFARSAFEHKALLQFDRANTFKDLPDVTIVVNACSQPPNDTFSSGITRLRVSSTFEFEPDPMHTLMDELVPSQSLLAVTSLHNAQVEELNKKLDSQTRFRTKQSGIAKKAFETAKDYCSEAEENLENVHLSKSVKECSIFVKRAEEAAVRANKAANSAEAVYLEVEASVVSSDEICEKLLSAENIFLTKISNSSSFSIDVDVESKKNDKKAEIDAKKAAAQTAATDIKKFATDARAAATAAEAAVNAATISAKALAAAAPVPTTSAERKARVQQQQAKEAAEKEAFALQQAKEAAERKALVQEQKAKEAAEKKRLQDEKEAAAVEAKAKANAATEQKRLEDEKKAAVAAEQKRLEDEKKAASAAAEQQKHLEDEERAKMALTIAQGTAAAQQKRLESDKWLANAKEKFPARVAAEAKAAALLVGINMDDFNELFTCSFEEMYTIAEIIKVVADELILSLFKSNPHLTKYMLFDENFTRTFLVIGILDKFLKNKNFRILFTGKTGLQLTAVNNDRKIDFLNSKFPPVPVDEFTAPGVCLLKICSDIDFSLVTSVPATQSLKETFIGTILLFFYNSGIFQNVDSSEAPPEQFAMFIGTPNSFLTLRSIGSRDTISVKKSLGLGNKLSILDVKFLTLEENLSIFPNLRPVLCNVDTGDFLRSIRLPSMLTFRLPDLSSSLNECAQITIKELTKLFTTKRLAYNESYFFTITTLLKFFSRAVQLSYIMANENEDTRSIFYRAVLSHYGGQPPNEQMKTIITDILNLFLFDAHRLNPETFRDFAIYKATANSDSETRVGMSLHTKILNILIEHFGFTPPTQEYMGGKKNKLKTKRKARKLRKTRKTRKTKNNNKKRFTRNIPPYKLTNKSRVRKC